MNTKVVMTLSAAVMAAAGIALTFMPGEVLGYLSGGQPVRIL